MLRTDLPDHRRATEEELLTALRERDPLALAESYHRTIPAAHATARRLLSASAEVEALLREVYSELWSSPPEHTGLEGWVRSRCFTIASEDLRDRDAPPASPSLTTLLPELPRPEVRYLDAAERALAELDDAQRRALLLAHDKGVPSEEQDADGAAMSLIDALLALAGPEPGADPPQPQACADVPQLGDWVLGLLPADRAASIAAEVAARPECGGVAKAMRRGRRRLEGLPPTPDMGQRVLVTVLAGAPAPMPAVAPVGAAAVPGAAGIHSALDATPPPAPAAAGGEARSPWSPPTDDREDTGDLSPPEDTDPPGPVRRDPSDVYAELAALDEASDAGEPVGELPAGDTHVDDEPDERQGRSALGRVVIWIMAALFLVAGVAAGLYLGLTLLN